MCESLSDAPRVVIATSVFNDGDVSRFSCWCAVIIGLEWVVALEDYDVVCSIASKFTNFNELNVREFVPVCVSTLVR